jgi:pimeloyl-ACP methyl ester carboxylesterase
MTVPKIIAISSLTILFSITSPALAAEAAESPAPSAKKPPKEKCHLYLLIGQSNMAGRGAIEEQDKIPHPRVLKFNKANQWEPAIDPLHFDKPAVAGVGLGSSFARAMADRHPDSTIGVIPCAVGGTPLARWMKGGDLYEQALVRARLALQDGTLKGILWHQGENDAGSEKLARSYAERLAQMVKDLRADLGAGDVPFVAGKLGEYLARKKKDGTDDYWPIVNDQIATLPKLVTNAGVVESNGLKPKSDGVHFDTPSIRTLGRRYAEVMIALQEKH